MPVSVHRFQLPPWTGEHLFIQILILMFLTNLHVHFFQEKTVCCNTLNAINTWSVILNFRLLASSLDVLDGSFSALSYIDDKDPAKNTAMNIATQLLTLPTPSNVQQNTKSLLASLYTNKAAYHAHKVKGVQQKYRTTIQTLLAGRNFDICNQLIEFYCRIKLSWVTLCSAWMMPGMLKNWTQKSSKGS